MGPPESSAGREHRQNADVTSQFLACLRKGELRYMRHPQTGRAMGYNERLGSQSGQQPEWVLASGGATLHSFVVYHQRYSEEFPPPYNVAMIALDEGPLLVSTVLTPNLKDLRIGARLTAVIEPTGRLVFAPSAQ